MIDSTFGILYAWELKKWNTSSTTVAFIYNFYKIMWRLTGVIVGTLTDLFGFRPVALVGSLLVAVSTILSAFATSSAMLVIFFSLGCGE